MAINIPEIVLLVCHHQFEGKEKERYSLKMIPVINSPEGRKGLAD